MLTSEQRREDFPTLDEMTYLNTAAESIPPRCVNDALQEYARDKRRGMKGRDAHYTTMEACREISGRWLGLDTEEVGFCSCSSEAYNLLATALNLNSSDEVVVTDLDFPAGATPWMRAASPPLVRLWKSNAGELRLEDLRTLLGDRTRLVQVSLVSFYNGFRVDWTAIRDLVRRHAPGATISVDITQALGRVALNCADADILISSTHKWSLGIHGGCIVGVPRKGASSLTTRAGGWFHLANAFDPDRFDRAIPKSGAASYSVGMPNFAALYALNASLRYLGLVGIESIERHSNPLSHRIHEGLIELGLVPLAPWRSAHPTGIVAFRHPHSERLHRFLDDAGVHVMHHAGRIRISVHGYNTNEDVSRFLEILKQAL